MSALEKAILDSFLKEHPEIKIRKRNGKIIAIQIPIDADIVILDIKDYQLVTLKYLYEDKWCYYSIV